MAKKIIDEEFDNSLESVLKEISKQYGEGSVMLLLHRHMYNLNQNKNCSIYDNLNNLYGKKD